MYGSNGNGKILNLADYRESSDRENTYHSLGNLAAAVFLLGAVYQFGLLSISSSWPLLIKTIALFALVCEKMLLQGFFIGKFATFRHRGKNYRNWLWLQIGYELALTGLIWALACQW